MRRPGTRQRVPHARELGWDDSLYEDGPGDTAGPDGASGGGNGGAGPGDGSVSPSGDGAAAGGEGGDRSGRKRKGGSRRNGSRPRNRRGKRRILLWVSAALALLVLGTAGAGYLYYRHLDGKLKKEDLTLGDKPMADHKANSAGQTPLNILLIGSDARDSKENQKLGGAKDTFGGTPLADVQMLLHVSADRSNMSVVSMPRDTMLKMPKCTDPDTREVYPASTDNVQTNESLGRGGPGCTVATWYELTGITIDHFMMIDFAGVVSMADAIGGVPVCVQANVHSRNAEGKGSGLKLKKGENVIQGEQALQWLRTRYGFEDGSDLARTHAQHMYMNSMVRELRKGAKLTDPGKLMSLAEAATDALTVDKGLGGVKKLYDLAEELKKVPTNRITMATMPNVYGEGTQAGRVFPKPGDAEQLFTMVRDDVPLDGKASKRKPPAETKDPAAAPADTGVLVRNGTGSTTQAPTPQRATAVAGLLVGKGYTKAVSDSTPDPTERTQVLFPSADLEGDAQAVAKSLGIPVSSAKKSADVSGVTVVVGADWRSGDTYPKSAAPDETKTPDTARALNGADETECMEIQPGFTF
ncbi:transcriptional regulator [Streptomyces camponoticapitis]|uniref:Transcriptional regulator n=1 Tax=Streptomyces camponoticapitis TaxID=1616125 RepID=A0ABQ2EHA2_9ACTN|nr:LCP family protein [Streptomyces camponoticapitis]GGK09310.1 transcriptional regulator [Streptomyces camponoticapitis]